MDWNKIKGKVKFSEPLKKYTTFKIGGKAEFFIEPRDKKDLGLLVKTLNKERTPFLILGAGSNLLVSDGFLRKAVIRLSSGNFKKVTVKGRKIKAGAGSSLKSLMGSAQKNRLSGLEFLAGLPATVGGALAMNAGAWGHSIGDFVEKVTIMDYNGRIRELPKEKLEFTYRHSSINGCIILEAIFDLKKDALRKIKQRALEYLETRKLKQDLSKPSAGCIFKNPPQASAGKLIDSCGLKGKYIGDALVSSRHANFIINRKAANFKEVSKLISLVRKRVKNKFGVNLHPEIQIWR